MASNMQKIGYVAVVVRDYDEALAFYTGVLGFDLIEDTALEDGKRWVLRGVSADNVSAADLPEWREVQTT